MELDNNEKEFPLKLHSQRIVYFDKETCKNTQIRIIAEKLKQKGLILIEDATGSQTIEFAQLTHRGKKEIEKLDEQ